MLRLTKKTEYALLALRMMGRAAAGDLLTAKAIATQYHAPEMLLAKVLQRLKQRGIVLAAKGSGGGYRLARSLGEIALTDVLALFDEPVSLVACQVHDDSHCDQLAHCDIKGPLAVLNEAIMAPIRHMTVEDLFVTPPPVARRSGPFLISH